MFFLQAARAPVIIQYEDLMLHVPKLLIGDIIGWGAEIMEEQLARRTQGMDDLRRREYLTLYPPVSPDLNEMKSHIRTPEGVLRIIRMCLPHAKVFDGPTQSNRPNLTTEQIDSIIAANGTGRLAGLAWELADINEASARMNPHEAPNGDGKQENKGIDPLTSSGKGDSRPLPVIGQTTSAHGTRPTQASIPDKQPSQHSKPSSTMPTET